MVSRRKAKPVEMVRVQVSFPPTMARQLDRLANEETEGRIATIVRKLAREALAARAAQ